MTGVHEARNRPYWLMTPLQSPSRLTAAGWRARRTTTDTPAPKRTATR
ncbi:hypothetical protein SAMN05428965_3344 [Geodermatophilus sp. DSM 45219]|nr:hypothetical protein SAMN05428965_3344 [Geodermatophilus sp. DSM 45219]